MGCQWEFTTGQLLWETVWWFHKELNSYHMTQELHSYFALLKITKNRRANKTVYMNAHNSFTARSKHLKMEETVIRTIAERTETGWVSVSCTSPAASMAGVKGLEEFS